MLLRPRAKRSVARHAVHTSFSHKIYGEACKSVERSHISSIFWEDNLAGTDPSLVVMIQLCTDKTVTYLPADAVAAYHVNVFLLNFTLQYCEFLIDHGIMFSGLLPAFTTALQKKPVQSFEKLPEALIPAVIPNDILHGTMEWNTRTVIFKLLHDAMQQSM